MRRLIAPVATSILAVGLVWLLAATWLKNTSLVTPVALIQQAAQDGLPFYLQHAAPTLERAGLGYLIGNVIGLTIAATVLAVPRAEGIALPLAVVSQCLPITAFGPVLLIVCGAQTAIVALSALLVLFPTAIATIIGGRGASLALLDLAHVNGASRRQLLELRLRASWPSASSALVVGVPSAMLGAVLGEYFGGIQDGLGVALHAAQYQMADARMWTLALIIVAVTLIAYGTVGTLARVSTRWARATEAS